MPAAGSEHGTTCVTLAAEPGESHYSKLAATLSVYIQPKIEVYYMYGQKGRGRFLKMYPPRGQQLSLRTELVKQLGFESGFPNQKGATAEPWNIASNLSRSSSRPRPSIDMIREHENTHVYIHIYIYISIYIYVYI